MTVKVLLKLRLLSIRKISSSDHWLTLNLKNMGHSILKNMVVKLHSPDPKLSTDCTRCFVYALMPKADQNVKFRAFASSLGGAYFSVSGYARGDQYFSIKSPVISVRKETMENNILLS
ncbi:MAG TPA: hypothetical protein VF893_05045 [Candidatus Bathyarchaeia archaeon]